MSEKSKRYNNGKLRWRNISHFMLKGFVDGMKEVLGNIENK